MISSSSLLPPPRRKGLHKLNRLCDDFSSDQEVKVFESDYASLQVDEETASGRFGSR